MLIRLFDRELTQQELTEAAARQGISSLPIMDNPMQQTTEQSENADPDVINALVNDISAAPHILHIMYQLESVSLPMLSLYMDLEQATVISYKRSGLRVSRMLNPQELKRLLLECFANLPVVRSSGDVGCVVTGYSDSAQLVKQICSGEIADIQTMPQENSIALNDIKTALRVMPGVRCVFEDSDSKLTSYYGVSDGESVFCIFPGDNGMNITHGSARPVIDAVSRGWMGRCRELIRASAKNA